MQKILFVCLGNICRSPVAEGIMLHLNDKHNLKWTIDS
ncbi:MAG: low molecular weight phosphotyrosine protein phosphatase, partial [Bacteroidia bacterium]|nr:low molecular weight phosphotyrosine protein phosphatase [Bacteroidia bacterium]